MKTQLLKQSMKKINCTITALALLALTVTQSLGQSTYEPYTFTTLAGGGGFVSPDQMGTAVRFNNGPTGVAVDSAGNLYVADFYFNTIRKGYPAPRILKPSFNLGQFGFNLSGPPGQPVIVEASTDLVSWRPTWTNTFTGTINFRDPQTAVSSNRFYRAHLP